MYEGEEGSAVAKSMEILVALGDIYGAEKLVSISSAQISGVSYKTIGDAGLEYLQELSVDAHVRVPSTLNPAGVDLEIWKELGFSEEFTLKQQAIVEAYQKMGVSTTCTCTPYLVGNVPTLGSHIAWSESSAVCYANSVLGARTNREGGPGALSAAICKFKDQITVHLVILLGTKLEEEYLTSNLKIIPAQTSLNGWELHSHLQDPLHCTMLKM